MSDSYQLDAVGLADKLRDRLTAFSAEDHAVSDPAIAAACRAMWAGPAADGGLVGDLWVEAALPAEGSDVTLDALAGSGKFDQGLCDHLDANGSWPRDRTLFRHQARAIEAARSGGPADRPALVVTAPTGGGKTESFLFPALDDLLRHPRQPGERGVRCLVLYPMNALVNDQIGRVHAYLKAADGKLPGHGLRLFHFTGETPEDHSSRRENPFRPFDEPRVQTRQEARGLETRRLADGSGGRTVEPDATERRPAPDVVITNYSMLAYMLCRPQDDWFFGPALRSVVLDEAHLYTGTLAAEITLLLRRVRLRCGRAPGEVLHLATSATLGGGEDALREFASKLFDKPAGRVSVIRGERHKLAFDKPRQPAEPPTAERVNAIRLEGPTIVLNGAGPELKESPVACDALRAGLATLVAADVVDAAADETFPARLLHRTLRHAPAVAKLAEALRPDGVGPAAKPIGEIAKQVFGGEDAEHKKAAAALLRLAAAARMEAGDLPLVPHRMHVLVRPADGVNVCLNPACPEAGPLAGFGKLLPGELDACDACGSAALALWRCDTCSRPHLAGVEVMTPDGKRYRPARWLDQRGGATIVLLDPAATGGQPLHLKLTGERCGKGGAAVSPAIAAEGCAGCGVALKEAVPLSSNSSLALSIAAETALAALPPFPGENDCLPARGRRMLAFSDSRAEAARLGPRLTEQHENQLVRAAVLEALGKLGDSAPLAEKQRRDIKRLAEDLETAASEEKGLYAEELAEKQAKLAQAEVGAGVGQLVAAFKWTGRIRELLDPDLSDGQGKGDPAGWDQSVWDENAAAMKGRAMILIARQIAQPIRTGAANGLENLGLIEIVFPNLDAVPFPRALTDRLDGAEAAAIAAGLGGTVWADFLAACCDELRAQGAVSLGSEEHDKEAGEDGRRFIGKRAAKAGGDKAAGAVNFVSRIKGFAAEVLRRAGVRAGDEAARASLAQDVAGAAFDALVGAARSGALPWLEVEAGGGGTLRVRFDRLAVRVPRRLFRCPTTGRVFPRSVLGVAPSPGGAGLAKALAEVSAAGLDADPRTGRLRREYREGEVFKVGLWGEEHSAQLSSGENHRLQELFKAGARNVLSSTTTMELGIDIGGLNGVLLANVPPGVANYLQRAGRAGRRSDGSAAVITFARPQPFDRGVFHDFDRYLARPMRRPTILLDRPRLARRHLHALLLGEYFGQTHADGDRTGAMDAFGKMGPFTGAPIAGRWEADGQKPQPQPRADCPVTFEQWREADPDPSLAGGFAEWLDGPGSGAEVRSLAAALVAGTPLEAELHDWPGLIGGVKNAFDAALNARYAWREIYAGTLAEWDSVNDSSQRSKANALHHQLKKLSEWTVIAYLGDRQFLPSFGFPINLKTLYVQENPRGKEGKGGFSRDSDRYKLSRGGLLALSEYAPGAKLFAGGRVIESRGLRRTWHGGNDGTAFGLGGWFADCVNGHFNFAMSEFSECQTCRGALKSGKRRTISPGAGFSTAGWQAPSRGGTLGTSGGRVGHVERTVFRFLPGGGAEEVRDFAGVAGLTAAHRDDGRVLVLNRGEAGEGFVICTACGYAESEPAVKGGRLHKGHEGVSSEFKKHRPINRTGGRACDGTHDYLPLRYRSLASEESTDVLMLSLPPAVGARDEAAVNTLALALRLAGADLLELDGRELAAAAVPADGGWYDLAVYDTAAGGAGHALELMQMGRNWLVRARELMHVNPKHDRACRTACLRCLLGFDSQRQVGLGAVSRPKGMALLDELLNGPPAAG